MEKKGTRKTTQRCNNPDCQRIRKNLQEEIRRLKSASYDMIKQTGDWQCGGRTHDDHSEMFESLFFHDVDELSLQLHTKSGIDEQAARVMLCQLFQTVYDKCRGRVLDRMKTTLSNVGSVSAGPGGSVSEAENLHDACRAYGLLLHSSHLRKIHEHHEISMQVHTELMQLKQSLSAAEEELKKFTNKVAEMSWDLLTTVPPLVSSQPSKYSRIYHQKENWDSEHGDENMVYFRPVLFSSYEGRVTKKGWVTNRAIGQDYLDMFGDESLTHSPETFQKANEYDTVILTTSSDKPTVNPSAKIKHSTTNKSGDKYNEFVMVGDEHVSVKDVLSDLLQPAASAVVQGHEGEQKEEGTVEYEALSLLRLINR